VRVWNDGGQAIAGEQSGTDRITKRMLRLAPVRARFGGDTTYDEADSASDGPDSIDRGRRGVGPRGSGVERRTDVGRRNGVGR